MLISVQTEQEWQALARDVLGSDSLADDPRFAGNPNRVVHRAALDGAIQAILSTRTRADWVKQLDRARIAFGTLSSLDDLTDHPQVWWRDVETPAGSVRVLAPAALFDGANPVSGRVPSHDEHGALIRREFARHPTLADA